VEIALQYQLISRSTIKISAIPDASQERFQLIQYAAM